jgi:hypothetical protein
LTLFFHSDRPGGLGGYDLWMCARAPLSEAFGEPVNLGPTVNSSHRDGGPALSADGRTLVFASHRPGGQGKDLWMCKRGSSSDSFDIPVNLGRTVNSAFDDGSPSLSADGRTVLFDSKRSGEGGWDLWMARIEHPRVEERQERRSPVAPIVPNPENKHFYQRIDLPMSWHDAKKNCESRGGHLATVTSAEENNFICRNFATDYACWLGATDEIEEGTWRWVTGEPFEFQNWASNEPSDRSYEEHSEEDYLVLGNATFEEGSQFYRFGSMWNDHAAHGRFFGSHIAFPLCEWKVDDQGTVEPPQLPHGVVLYMTFDRGTITQMAGITTVKDLSGAGNHGLGEGVAYTSGGRAGGGLAIQGGVLHLPRTLLDKRAEYTIVAWVNKASADEDLILYREYGYSKDGVRGPILYETDFIEPSGRMRAKCWNGNKPDHWVHVNSPAKVAAEQWHFVAITLSDAVAGRGTLTLTIDDESFSHDFQVFDLKYKGHGSLGAGRGVLDEVAIFDRALSREEIQALYAKGKIQAEKGNGRDGE